MDDESSVRSEVECDAMTTLEDWACKCLLSYGDDSGGNEGRTPPVGDKMWLMEAGASDHFTYDSIKGYADCNKALCCAGGATYPIVGPVT